ncbi:DUF2934 domain-containing protein [Mesorhizobium sp. BAC0120]|uniref:DUF2934 domain-containing protein n=1 Tax=Mesorhizobium sp. BAC0120 TaxID=3090670 RepID=UPI00298D05AC|nr:DUF2934 domain-containing protein [Mesorhizobium sp. BAC0120]MDW6022978.1 DUF2934 domain-containing protein [Mesorhizobium sp. BAC0120]
MAAHKEERIRQRAHAIWEREGKPHGSDARHWDQATREIEQEDAASVAPPKPKKTRSAATKATETKKTAADPKTSAKPRRRVLKAD